MKKSSIKFLQFVVILVGVVAAGLLLWEPWLEGVNAGATTLAQIYFDDPFLALVYAGSIPFFIAVYQAVKLLGYAGANQLFSPTALRPLRVIKYCALTIIGFVAAEELFIMLNHGSDDATGGFMMGVFITFGSVVVATVAAVFERVLQSAVEFKAENDLTV